MKEATFKRMVKRCTAFCRQIEANGGYAVYPKIEEPATERDILALERELKATLPDTLRAILRTNTKHFSFRWFLPDNFVVPSSLNGVYCADLTLKIDQILKSERARRNWLEQCFPDINDPYDRVWHNKIAFLEVGNGDFWAFDLKSPNAEHIVYLSHDDGKGHGFVIGTSFESLLLRWCEVGCPGCDDHGWLPFWNKASQQLEPDCQREVTFRKLLGFQQ